MFGYEFLGWDTPIAETMDINDLVYTAQWKGNPNTPYYLEYYVKDPETDQYVMLGGQNGRLYKEGTTGELVNVKDYLLEDPGYAFYMVTINGQIANTSMSGKIDPKGKLTIRYYYEAESYPLSFDAGYGVINGQVPDEYYHGTSLSLADVTATMPGYRFLGWFEGQNAEEATDTILPSRVGEIRLTARWEAKTNVLHLFDGETSLGTVTATYDELLPALEQIPAKAGYTFEGYYTAGGDCYYDRKGYGQLIWEQFADVNLQAKWTPREVEIAFDANGGEEVIPVEGIYLGKYPVLPETTREGYEFVGWTLGGEIVTSDTTIDQTDDHTLVARWNPVGGTPYTVECYVPDSNEETGYRKYDSIILFGMTDTVVAVGGETYFIPGYEFDAAAEENVLSATLMADGSTVLKMYYREGNRYQITFHYGYDIPATTESVAMNENFAVPWGLPEGVSGPSRKSLVGWKLGNVFYKPGTSFDSIQCDMEFNAVWEDEPFGVYYRYWDPDTRYETFVSQDVNVESAGKVLDNLFTKSPKYDDNDVIIGYYEFAGWNTESEGIGTTYQPGADISAAIEEAVSAGKNTLDLYVQWNYIEASDDLVRYDVVHQITSVDNWPKEYRVAHYGKVGEQTKASAYSFVGATVLTDSIEQQTLAKDSETEITITYKWNTYSIKLDYAGGNYNGQTELEASGLEKGCNLYASLGNVDVSDIKPTKNGYEFAGWDVNIPDYMPAHDIVATAQYKETGTYPVTVKYLTENADGSGYTEVESEIVFAEPGEFTPNPRTYNGFVTPDAKTVTVTEDGAECSYQYDRAAYTITWYVGEGSISSEEGTYSSGQVKYGTAITAPEVFRAGYSGVFKNFTGTMPAQDITYKAEWTPQKVEYHVMYRYREKDTDPNLTTLCTQRFEALAGSVVETSSEIPESQPEAREKVASGYVQPLPRVEKISGDGSTIITYDYELQKYHLSYDFSGGRATTSNYAAPADYPIGKQLQIPPLTQVEKKGYKAVGWYDINDPAQTIVEGITIRMADRDVTYKMKWEPITYSITYDLAMDGAENPYNRSWYRNGFDFNIAGALCEHYAFKGWEWNGDGTIPEGVEIMENGLVHVTDEAVGDLSFKATWDPYMKQFVGMMYEGASELYIYNYPENVDLTFGDVVPPTREGYIFDYWTIKIPSTKSGYQTISVNDNNHVRYYNVNTHFTTAKWLAISDMGDGYYYIHVNDYSEFEDAIRIMKEQPQFRGIKLEQSIHTNILYKPLMDVWDEGYVLDGQNHAIKYGNGHNRSPLFKENHGTIQNLDISGPMDIYVEGDDATNAYAGMLVVENYGLIKDCRITESSFLNTDARYIGGLVGYNEGTITRCDIRKGLWQSWEANSSAEKGNTVVYEGGFVGYNAYNGVIKNCEIDSGLGCGVGEAYVGGIAGMNQGLISKCTVTGYVSARGSEDRNGVYRSIKGYAGGIAGIDASYDEADPDKELRGIFNCTVKDCSVMGDYAAGGLIGECNYSSLEGNELIEVEVYTREGYGGLMAGVFDSMQGNSTAYNYVTDAKVRTDEGKVDVIAGYGRGRDLPSKKYYPITVRSRDDKTRVVVGDEYTYYKKGQFYFWFLNTRYCKHEYYDAKRIVNADW